MTRQWSESRKTGETEIELYINLDEYKEPEVDTGIGFFDHMLYLAAYHGKFTLELNLKGDLHVCDHHSVEDAGITLGKAFAQALGDKRGVRRYGNFRLPMDEVLVNVSLDFSGRGYLVFNCDFTREDLGTMSTEMIREFFYAFAIHSGTTLHINVEYGFNDHHKAEGIFKAWGRALRDGFEVISDEIPSTKGLLE